MEVPLGLGGRFDRVPVFGLSLALLSSDQSTIEQWDLQIACRRVWSFGFDVLLGQRGWFDTFTTTFGEDRFTVENRGEPRRVRSEIRPKRRHLRGPASVPSTSATGSRAVSKLTSGRAFRKANWALSLDERRIHDATEVDLDGFVWGATWHCR